MKVARMIEYTIQVLKLLLRQVSGAVDCCNVQGTLGSGIVSGNSRWLVLEHVKIDHRQFTLLLLNKRRDPSEQIADLYAMHQEVAQRLLLPHYSVAQYGSPLMSF
jgi:hypothetical protein